MSGGGCSFAKPFDSRPPNPNLRFLYTSVFVRKTSLNDFYFFCFPMPLLSLPLPLHRSLAVALPAPDASSTSRPLPIVNSNLLFKCHLYLSSSFFRLPDPSLACTSSKIEPGFRDLLRTPDFHFELLQAGRVSFRQAPWFGDTWRTMKLRRQVPRQILNQFPPKVPSPSPGSQHRESSLRTLNVLPGSDGPRPDIS